MPVGACACVGRSRLNWQDRSEGGIAYLDVFWERLSRAFQVERDATRRPSASCQGCPAGRVARSRSDRRGECGRTDRRGPGTNSRRAFMPAEDRSTSFSRIRIRARIGCEERERGAQDARSISSFEPPSEERFRRRNVVHGRQNTACSRWSQAGSSTFFRGPFVGGSVGKSGGAAGRSVGRRGLGKFTRRGRGLRSRPDPPIVPGSRARAIPQEFST